MGFILALFYIFTTLMTPAEIMPALLPYRIMLVLLIVTLLASSFGILSNRFSFKAPQFYLALALVAYCGASILWALRWFGGALGAIMDVLFLVGISLMICWTVSTLKRLRILVALLALVGAIITLEGIVAIETGNRREEFVIQEGHDPDSGTGQYQSYVNRIRGLGRLNDPNDLAQFLIVDVALLGCCWQPRRAARNLIIVIIPAAFLLTGVALTRSRGAILALVVMVLILLQRRMGKFGYIVGAIVGVGAVGAMAVLTGRDLSMKEDSAAGRLDAWYAGMQMFKGSPVFGVGFDRFTEHHPLTAHNSYMLCIAELGFPGFLIWLGLIVSSLFQMRSLASGTSPASDELKQTAQSMFTAIVMFAVTAWFLSRSYSTVLFVIIGMAISILEIARREGVVPDTKTERAWKLSTVAGGVAILATIYVTLRIRGLSL